MSLGGVGEGEADRVVAARGAVEQEPAALGAPGLGGEPLRALEGRRLRADVDSLDARRDVVQDRRLAEHLGQPRVAAGALVAGDVEAAGVARDVGGDRVEVGGFALVGHSPVRGLAARVLGVRVPPLLGGDLALDVHVLGLLEGLEALAAQLAARARTA